MYKIDRFQQKFLDCSQQQCAHDHKNGGELSGRYKEKEEKN